MARLDVYRSPEGVGYVLDVQAELLERLGTRVVVPLLPKRAGPPGAARLNPVFVIEGYECVLVAQHIVAIPKAALGERVGSLRDKHFEIQNALDLLLLEADPPASSESLAERERDDGGPERLHDRSFGGSSLIDWLATASAVDESWPEIPDSPPEPVEL